MICVRWGESFKKLVKGKIHEVALVELSKDCKDKKKTSALSFTVLKPQDYLNHLYPTQAKIIFQCRSKTLDIKAHRSYKYKDKLCRKCGDDEETVQHVANCGSSDVIDTSFIDELSSTLSYDTIIKLILISKRIHDFLEEVK